MRPLKLAKLSVLALPALAMACTPPAIPPAVGEADALLARRDTQIVAAARPRLVAEATALAQRAREAAERGESERATLLARQAVQKLQTAKNFAEREQSERMGAALEKSTRPTQAPTSEALPAEPRAVESERASREGPRADGSLRGLAERALVQVALRRGEMLGQLRDQSCAGPFRELEAMIELAQKRFDAGDYERAYEFALRADERLRACELRASTAPLAKRDGDDEAARKKASAALQKAQVEAARVQAQNREDPAAVQARALMQSADTWYQRRSYAEATELATRAHALLVRVKAPTPPATNPARDEAESALTEARRGRERCPEGPLRTRGVAELAVAERAFLTRAYTEATTAARRAADTFRAAAKDGDCAATKKALEATRALEPKGRALDSGAERARREALGLLASADAKLESGACEESRALAERAKATFVKLAQPSREPHEDGPRSGDFASSEAAKRAEAFVAERLGKISAMGAEPIWRAAYRDVFLAMAMREEASRMSPHMKDALLKADAMLRSAKDAWDKQRYSDASRVAKDATLVLDPLAAPRADEGSPEALARARGRASLAVQASIDLSNACDSARCVERSSQVRQARALLDSAKGALASGRFAAASDIAKTTQELYEGALRAALPGSRAEELDAAARRATDAEAEAALRDAMLAKKACETNTCDAELSSRGRISLGLAIAARTDGRPGEGRDLAREGAKLLRAAVAPVFEIPVQARGVTRDGSRLVVTPPLAFKAFVADLATSSEGGVAALARTLVDNQRALRRVRLVVRPEPGGYPPVSARIAQSRADRLRALLVGRGVSAELLVTEVAKQEKAPDDASRRVEIFIELSEGTP